MEENNSNQIPRPTSSSDKLEIVKILVLAVVSFVAGFAIIFFLLRPDAPSAPPAPESSTSSPIAPVASAPPPTPVAPADTATDSGAASVTDTSADTAATGTDTAATVPDGGSSLPEVPPGKTPENIAVDGEPFYLKCWDESGVEHPGKDCERLDVLEKRFSSRLYVVEKCRADVAAASNSGKLSVASEVDFAKQKISFWNGASSDIANAGAIGTCLRTALAGLPIHGVEHKYSRYRIFYTVLFGKAAARRETAPATPTADSQTAGPAPSADKRKGRMMDIKKDNVRVRKTPVDGEIIGKISTGNQVKLIGQKNGWCNIITPNNNEGWLICDALGL